MAASVVVRWWMLLALVVSSSPWARSQQQDEESPILVGDSGVGYIDSAVLGDQMRVRFEAAYDIDKANRAEFIWAWPPVLGDGPPLRESSTNYQSLNLYLEHQWRQRLSTFVELGGVLSDPELNDNSGGLGDMNLGLKCALLQDRCAVTTGQLRVYVPTGDAERGLGTDHVSMEPSLLHFRRFNSIWTSESELRYFFPIGGTEDKRGPMFRYGTGLSCMLLQFGSQRLSAVTEFVGWTVLDGEAAFVDASGASFVESAEGDTIINGKFGGRWRVGCNDFYAGYGRALTGDVWYEDVLRVEWRRRF